MEEAYFVIYDHALDFEISKRLSKFEFSYIGFKGLKTVCFCSIMSCVMTHYCLVWRYHEREQWSHIQCKRQPQYVLPNFGTSSLTKRCHTAEYHNQNHVQMSPCHLQGKFQSVMGHDTIRNDEFLLRSFQRITHRQCHIPHDKVFISLFFLSFFRQLVHSFYNSFIHSVICSLFNSQIHSLPIHSIILYYLHVVPITTLIILGQASGTQILQKSRSHLKLLGFRRVTRTRSVLRFGNIWRYRQKLSHDGNMVPGICGPLLQAFNLQVKW